jgi:hypothetical protein
VGEAPLGFVLERVARFLLNHAARLAQIGGAGKMHKR